MAKKENLLYNIFFKNSKGELTNEIEKVNCIQYFFFYVISDQISESLKINAFKELTEKIRINRYISEYFSSFENKSIYTYLFDNYLSPNASDELKESILTFIDELLINIEIGKDVYEYLFQKFSQIYRKEIQPTPEIVKDLLILLSRILGDTKQYKKPKNYFACSGKCIFSLDLSKDPIRVGSSITININFKISQYVLDDNKKEGRKTTLIKIYFSNKKSFTVDLVYPYQLIVSEIRKDFIKILPNDEWINLIITISNIQKKTCFFSFFVNGENHPNSIKLEKYPLSPDTYINFIEFFSDFYGEVSSMVLFSQQENGIPGTNNSTYLSEYTKFKEGLWKKKIISTFTKMLTKYP